MIRLHLLNRFGDSLAGLVLNLVALLKLEPGFEMDAHSHSHAENHYVLEGMYETEGRECPSGCYLMVPKHKEHGPFRSQDGALLLVVWED